MAKKYFYIKKNDQFLKLPIFNVLFLCYDILFDKEIE